MIAEQCVNTLILVHTAALMEQWKGSLERFLTLEPVSMEAEKCYGRTKSLFPIGQIGAGKNNLSGIVDVGVMQSLVSEDEVKELVRNYGMIVVDECHHVPAVNFEKILSYANARLVYGLTATPSRQDGHHPIIFMQCGSIRYCVDAKEQAEKRDFRHLLIPRFTSFRSASAGEKKISEVYMDLAENALRNNMIVQDVINAVNNGRNPIVLTERREHVMLLCDLLSSHCKNIIRLIGSDSVKERRETMERLMSIHEDESFIIVATGRYV